MSDRGGGVRSRGERRPRGAPRGEGNRDHETDGHDARHRRWTAGTDSSAADGLGAGDDETRTLITRTYQRADAFLFGRRTYELFAGSWGAMEEMRAHPIGVALNETPKYVASTTLTGPRWADTTVLSGDLAVAVGELKARPGGELQVHGSGTLVRWLLENDLVDEMTLLIVPVVLGQGTRLFPGTGPDMALDLAGSRADSKGVTQAPRWAAGRVPAL